MKVLFVVSKEADGSWRPGTHQESINYLPCETIKCFSAAAVREHAESADVILLAGKGWYIPFWNEIRFISKLPCFIAKFQPDLHHEEKQSGGQREIRVDAIIVRAWERTSVLRPKWLDKAFWAPHSINVQDYHFQRDIDIISWGRLSQAYPFRRWVRSRLLELSIGDKQTDAGLRVHTICFGGLEYKLAVLKQYAEKFYSIKLYELLSRTKICVTGPGISGVRLLGTRRKRTGLNYTSATGIPAEQYLTDKWRLGGPLAKYFENAACGTVTMTYPFTDSEALGFEHKKTIWFTNRKDFMRDLQYLLEHDNVVQEISENSRELIRTRHTPAVRAQELYKFLCEKTGKT